MKDRHLITYECGCVNNTERTCGALVSVSKCDKHLSEQRETSELGEEYYRILGALDDDAPERYQREFAECFGAIPKSDGPNGNAVELGCGVSPYVRMFTDNGYEYFGVDNSRWALDRNESLRIPLASFFQCDIQKRTSWDSIRFLNETVNVVLCSHAMEHLKDPFAFLELTYARLVHGGSFYLIIPNDDDPVNPDHKWFFSEWSLRVALVNAGFVIPIMTSRRRVPHEQFIYCLARKPYA